MLGTDRVDFFRASTALRLLDASAADSPFNLQHSVYSGSFPHSQLSRLPHLTHLPPHKGILMFMLSEGLPPLLKQFEGLLGGDSTSGALK